MESVKDDREDTLSHDEEDDDPPRLTSQALEALKELLAEQNRTSVGDGASEDAVALVTEDWRLSQFWYDRETAETVVKEVHALCTSIDPPSVACIACPTLYSYLKAGLPTRVGQWWEGIPFLTSAVVVVCGAIYLICLLTGYDSFEEVCFLPSAVITRFQVYRIYTSVIFHGSLLHVLFNMLALVPLGSELERVMGSIRLSYITSLLATSNAILHLFIALLAANNPFHLFQYPMNECAIGFSGILFSMIVIETSLSGAQHRSVFGLFNVPAQWYAWILLVVFQLLMSNVSLLGHLCGILSGFAYTYGLFNFLIPGTSFYSAIESSSWLSTCVRRPKFIVCTGGNTSGYIPTYSNQNITSSGLLSGNVWRNLSSWMPQRETSAQSADDSNRFPGTGRTLGSGRNLNASTVNSDSSLQTRLLDSSNSPNHPSDAAATGTGQQIIDGRRSVVDSAAAATRVQGHQGSVVSDEEIQKLVAMGFERTQVEVALAAADGDLNVAVEILMSQEVVFVDEQEKKSVRNLY